MAEHAVASDAAQKTKRTKHKQPKRQVKHREGWLRRTTRPLRDALVVPALDSIAWLCRVVPQPALVAFARAGARLAMLFGGTARRRALRQLQETGVAATPAAARALAREMFFHMIFGALEWLRSAKWSAAETRGRINTIGLERVLELERTGLVSVTPHFGNWELIPKAHIAFGGVPAAIVMTRQRNAALNRWIVRERECEGTKLFFDRDGMIGLIKHLRRGGPVALLTDQDSNRWPGVFVDFFGRAAYTPEGPARLALRCGVPLVAVSIERDSKNPWLHTLTYGAPIFPREFSKSEAEDEAEVLRLTQLYTSELEQRIRRAPAQWMWLHDRWHHQPGRRIKLRKPRRED